jgi:hypothetical protein
MAELRVSESRPAPGGKAAVGRLFVLELNAGRIHTMNPDGSNKKTIVTDCRLPDGIAVDVAAGHIYWTNMGVPSLDDGSIERADLDGGNRRVIVPQGITHTPKQIHLDKENGKLYWSDREGMRVMRANLDGSQVETLVETGRGDNDRRDETRWCVGIALDPKLGKIYWTQIGPEKGGLGRLCRANINIPNGESPANRSDIEVMRPVRSIPPISTERTSATSSTPRATSPASPIPKSNKRSGMTDKKTEIQMATAPARKTFRTEAASAAEQRLLSVRRDLGRR